MLSAFLIPTLILLASVVSKLVMVQFVLSLLVAFNVISPGNNFVGTIIHSINALLEPMLGPIRRMMPYTGAIDFSPLVLIVLIQILIYFLAALPVMG